MRPLSPDRWRALSADLDLALEETEAERGARLERLRAQDPDLAAELEALLRERRDLSREGFLAVGPLVLPGPTSPAGQRIGPYTLVAPLGQGGMGSVWLAQRSDGRFAGQAALKMLNAGIAGSAAEERFRREGDILARLSHPHIAHLVDAGVAPSGQPYLVLEYVKGQRIDRFCDARRLSVEARLRLVLDVLEAVAHAHGQLIVHRDIKPANVLVTDEGQVKLLDFGIAKLLEGAETTGLTALTREGHQALTPEFAAPEQVRGDAVTTATDVYAVGILLYVLLTGRHPAQGALGSPAELMRAIVEADPPRPSDVVTRVSELTAGAAQENAQARGTSADQLARVLRDDLDIIVGKALKKGPAERYPSAQGLADDLRRHLESRPISARRDTLAYRASKFVRRHRAGVGLALLSALALAVGLLGTLSQARRARAQAARADSMRDFMFDAFAGAEPGAPQAGPATVVDAVERAIATARADRAADPRGRIELLVRLAQVLDGQGRFARNQALLTETLARAQADLGADDPLTLAAEDELAWNAAQRSDLPEARRRLDALLPRLPSTPEGLKVRTLGHSAYVATHQRDRTRALREARLAVDLSRASGRTDLLSEALTDLGNALVSLNALPEAVQTYEQALVLYQQRFGTEHANLATLQAALSRAYRRLGQLDLAEAHVRAAVAIDRKVYAGDHWRLALHLNNLGMVLQERRGYDEALAVERESLRMSRATLGEDNPQTLDQLNNVGMLLVKLENFAPALPLLRESLERTITRFGAEDYETVVVRANLAFALAEGGYRREGERELEHALRTAASLSEPDPDLTATCLEKGVRMALDAGDPATALEAVGRLDAQVPALPPGDPYWTGRADALRGEALLALGRSAEAAAALERAEKAVATVAQPDPVLSTALPLLRARAAQGQGHPFLSLASDGRARLGKLPHPPTWLARLAAP